MDDKLMREIDEYLKPYDYIVEHLKNHIPIGPHEEAIDLLQRARDRLDQQKWALMEIRGLVRPIIQNAPFILEHATPPSGKDG